MNILDVMGRLWSGEWGPRVYLTSPEEPWGSPVLRSLLSLPESVDGGGRQEPATVKRRTVVLRTWSSEVT